MTYDDKQLGRRTALKALGAAATIAVTACAGNTPSGRPTYARPLSRRPFVAPRVSMDRVVRVITGQRPFRPEGFVVRRNDIDGRALIHNYGHGGGGISISWGSSALAVREAADLPIGNAAVLGAGAMGMTTARLLQDAGWNVTIYSHAPSRHSTSNVAAGQWGPTSIFDEGVATADFVERYKWACRVSHHAFQNLIGPRYGVSFLENYYLDENPIPPSYYERTLPDLFAAVADLQPHEHPFPTAHVRRIVTMHVEPGVFLRQLRQDFRVQSGTFVVRHFDTEDDVLSLDERVIFNCTGLGSRALFGDESLVPIKGQLVFVLPDAAVDFATIGGGRGLLYQFPRTGELVLGGSYERGNWDRSPDPATTERIISEHDRIYGAMRV